MNFRDFHREIRVLKRASLEVALSGSSEERLRYCIVRAAAKHIHDFEVFGCSQVDLDTLGKRAAWWFGRLERLAANP